MEDAKIKGSPSHASSSITTISQTSIYPDRPSTLARLNLSVFDLRMLGSPYSKRGLLFTRPILPSFDLINHLSSSLSRALSFYPPLAGRLSTDADGSFFIACNDAGVAFVHAVAPKLSLSDLEIHNSDVPVDVIKDLFLLNGVSGVESLSFPVAAVQVTELADGVFVGCSINHAVVDGTSFWDFFNAWSELSRGVGRISRPPDFRRDFFHGQPAPCTPAAGRAAVGFTSHPVRNRVFSFSGKSIRDLKARANLVAGINEGEISSFQALCTLLWRSVTRARKLGLGTETTLRLAANCRHRMDPPLGAHYFGNANVGVVTVARAEDLLGRELGWCAQLLRRNVAAFGDEVVRKVMEKWKEDGQLLPMRKSDAGSFLVVASSPRFAVYENDMGWGRPVAVRMGQEKYDGGAWAFPGREDVGSIDLEVCLASATMDRLVSDDEFMQFVSH